VIKNCARAEILAGAIALGEATDAERDDYRRHLAACSSCVNAIGGEREIERTMAMVAAARDSEVWEPVLPSASVRRTRTTRVLGFGLSAAAVAVIASLGIHALVASQVRPVTLAAREASVPTEVMHVTIEPRSLKIAAPVKPKVLAPNIVVVHNVITLKPPSQQNAAPPATQSTVVAESRPFKNAPQSNVPVWRRDDAATGTQTQSAVSVNETASAPVLRGRAESIAVTPSYSVRDVAPLGGDTAINPRPPMIAYSLGAEGTTAFEVTVDEHGVPQKCTITKHSGYLVLDQAVCKAAMKARYSPRMVDGRAVSGVYRDAFTFRNTENNTDNQL